MVPYPLRQLVPLCVGKGHVHKKAAQGVRAGLQGVQVGLQPGILAFPARRARLGGDAGRFTAWCPGLLYAGQGHKWQLGQGATHCAAANAGSSGGCTCCVMWQMYTAYPMWAGSRIRGPIDGSGSKCGSDEDDNGDHHWHRQVHGRGTSGGPSPLGA